jgi:hypothetical protein
VANAPEESNLSISRPSYRAILFTWRSGDRELDLYAEALPDSLDHDWSIILDDLCWTRSLRTGTLSKAETVTFGRALVRRVAAEGLRVRWERTPDGKPPRWALS